MADILSTFFFFLIKKNADLCQGPKGCSVCQKRSIKTERPPVLAHPIGRSGAGKSVCLSVFLPLMGFLFFFFCFVLAFG